MKSDVRILKRKSPPNFYDQAPQNSHCYVTINEYLVDVYIQRSLDEETPEWDLLGTYKINDLDSQTFN